MVRRLTLWKVAAALFTLVNLLGGVYAAAVREPIHAGVHVVLTLLGAYWMWMLATRTARQELPSELRADERIEQLQQSVDAVALEVERVGEAQRFSDKLQKERVDQRR
jgi:hypothetical protein